MKNKPAPKPEKPAPKSPEIKRLEEVFRLMGTYGVGELELEDKQGRVHARMGSVASAPSVVFSAPAPTSTPASTLASAPTVAGPSASGKPAAAALAPNQKRIASPFVGTFYRSSGPSAEPYVKEGVRVKKGQTLCIVEAMKLMNEIESEFDGTIVSILVENGQPVEFGEPLFVVEV
jgi:acetyl-CoA carboxylase biotin carboxyl carrier protein